MNNTVKVVLVTLASSALPIATICYGAYWNKLGNKQFQKKVELKELLKITRETAEQDKLANSEELNKANKIVIKEIEEEIDTYEKCSKSNWTSGQLLIAIGSMALSSVLVCNIKKL